MAKKTLPLEIAGSSANLEALVERVARKPELLPEVFAGLRAEKPKIKYGCLKLLRLLSEKYPAVLYPEFEQFVNLLDSENNILQWGGLIIIGNLAAVDSAQKIEPVLDRFLQPISGPVLITAANAIGAAGKIALAKPALAGAIARSFLQVEKANYQTPECRNVVLGHAVQSFGLFFHHLADPQPVTAFMQRQLRNPRNAVKKKAAAFLKRHRQNLPSPDNPAQPSRIHYPSSTVSNMTSFVPVTTG